MRIGLLGNPDSVGIADKCIIIIHVQFFNLNMEIFTVNEFYDRYDEIIKRTENGEYFGVVNEDGESVVIMPYDKYWNNNFNHK